MIPSKERIAKILKLALPIIGGMISQNILNLVDTAMVGKLGNSALAAVGVGGFANFLAMSLLIGVSFGVQTMASRRRGEQRNTETAVPLNGGLAIVSVLGLFLSVTLYCLTPYFYPYLNSDPEVISYGIDYLQMRLIFSVCVGINFSFRGFWNAVDLSRVYMGTLVFMHISNIILNYIFIFGNFGAPELGVEGAALGTGLSTLIGSFIYIFLGVRLARSNGFLKRFPSSEELKTLIKLSIPNSIQQFFFAGGFTCLYWIIGLVGAKELAAANVLINVNLVSILPGIGLGLASATLVGQSLGRGNHIDAKRWGYDVAKIGLFGIGLIGIPMVFIPEIILGIFIQDLETLTIARLPMIFSGLTIALDAGVGLVLMNSLLGAGDSGRVMKVSVALQWLFFLPLAYLVGPVLGQGLLAIWVLNGIYRLIQAGFYWSFWHREKWIGIKV